MLLFLATTLLASSDTSGLPEILPKQFQIKHYDVELRPDIHTASIEGKVSIQLNAVAPVGKNTRIPRAELKLDVGDLTINSATLDGEPIVTEKRGTQLFVTLTSKAALADSHTLSIVYEGKPKKGLYFLPEYQQLYTAFDTSEWLPCDTDPKVRASLNLKLTLPSNYVIAANGKQISSRTTQDGKTQYTWLQNEQHACYLYGFAAGVFRDHSENFSGVELRYLLPPEFKREEIDTIFGETKALIRFYEEKSGKKYPAASYTQVLVNASVAQELDGLAIMSAKYGRRVLKDPSGIWLIAHELSHQWWGNRVTNASWTEMWLNEGIASYINAAFLESRFGIARFDSQLNAAKEAYLKLVSEGKDHALVFPDWDHPSSADRSIVYDKGMYVMHLLRLEVGDDAFWKGLALFTHENWQASVRSEDLQKAMERASHKNLSTFFTKWVYEVR